MPSKTDHPLRIAIIGGGLVGVALSLGLLRRKMTVRLYEQTSSFREIGAGVAFTTNAQTCMELLSPDILAAMKAVSTKNESPYYTYVDGYRRGPNQTDDDADLSETLLYKLHAGTTGFDACHRAHFLDEMVKKLPHDVVSLGARLEAYAFDEDAKQYTLHFVNGATATADVIIGCDGIKSRVRQLLLGADQPHPPTFAHQVAFRGLVRMERAVAALGTDKAHNQCMHTGPGAHLLTFPVAQHTLMNIVAFAPATGEWPDRQRMAVPATAEEVRAVFGDWRPAVRSIVRLLVEAEAEANQMEGKGSLDKWAIFDMFEHPAPTYASGGVCIAGDAAHATSPHHGAGAGMGIEDALALATVLELAEKQLSATASDEKEDEREQKTSSSSVVAAALAAYDAVRRERTQWLVRSSREVSATYEWSNPDCGDDPDKCLRDIEWRAHKIWHFDIDGMLADAKVAFQSLLHE